MNKRTQILPSWADISRSYFFLILLLSSLALAQGSPEVSRGGALKKRAYQTYGTLTYFIDPTGNDGNACTASGTSACATWAGLVRRLPRFIRHNVTVNIAAGTYAEVFRFIGFTIGQQNDLAGVGPTFTINGTLAAPTLTTGTTTGSVTSYTAASGATLAVLTDTTQAWTTNELRGQFLQMTSGSANGSYFVITANTSNTLTLATNGSIAPTNTYAIVTAATIFTGGTHIIRGNTNGTLAINNVRWAPGTTPFDIRQNTVALSLTRNQVISVGAGAAFGANAPSSATFTITGSYVTSDASNCGVNLQGPAAYAISGGYWRNSTTGGITACVYDGPRILFFNGHFEGNPTSEAVLEVFRGSYSGNQQSATVHCGGSGSALFFPHPGETSQGAVGAWSIVSMGIFNCSTGIRNESLMYVSAAGLTLNTVTTGFDMKTGGTINFRFSTPTFTTVTNELQLDGENYTFSFLTGLATPQVLTNSYGSSFIP